MTGFPGNNVKIYIAAALCACLATASFWQAAQTWAGFDARLIHGRIVDYEMVHLLPPIPLRTPRYAVEFQDGGQRRMVHSTSALELFNLVPQNVTFWYSGDPSREVRLLETASPAMVGLVFAGLAIAALAFVHGHGIWQWIDERTDRQASDSQPI